MPVTLTTVRGALARNGVKILVHGKAGVGKTRLCATMPATVVLSAESGLLSLAKVAPNLPVIPIATMDDLNDAYAWAESSAEAKRFQSISLDSISDIAEAMLATCKKATKEPRKAYGEVQDNMMETMRLFRDLPGKHVYFSAKTELREVDEGLTRYLPSFPGKKLGPAAPYLFDEVFYYTFLEHEGKEYRVLRTQPDFQTEAKDRSGALSEIEEPDLGKLIQKIQRHAK